MTNNSAKAKAHDKTESRKKGAQSGATASHSPIHPLRKSPQPSREKSLLIPIKLTLHSVVNPRDVSCSIVDQGPSNSDTSTRLYRGMFYR